MILCNHCGTVMAEGAPRCAECNEPSPFASRGQRPSRSQGAHVGPLNKYKDGAEQGSATAVETGRRTVGAHQNGSPSAGRSREKLRGDGNASGRASGSTARTHAPGNRFAPLLVSLIICVVLISVGVAAGVWMLRVRGNKKGPDGAPPAGMVLVPGGTFLMGRKDGDEYERPERKVTVRAFYIDTHEVTREEYQKFIKDTGHRAPPGWVNGQYPQGTARYPVTGVDWDDASAYAAWADKRLPTEEEWEFAARGTGSLRYPWGNAWKPGAANADPASQRGLAEVGQYKGVSPFGAFDMVGNVWEWTASRLSAYPGGRIPEQQPGDLRVIRGGSWQSDQESATTTYRWGRPARDGADYSNTGFRCVKNAAPPSVGK